MPLRPATPADLPALVALVNAAYRGDASKAGWTTEADFIEGDRIGVPSLQADLADSAVHLLLLPAGEPGEPPLGCVRLEAMGDGRVWMLGMLSVRPTAQAQGAGRVLLAGAEAHALSRGAAAIRMTVITIRDTLIAWYGRRGYADTGERQPYAYGGALRPLEFVVLEKVL